ncbi:hypothetical protein M0804_012689 [Polistes exclamans]|nr:hypothetical protein M0804_012689 [Polistes exclamans]
MILVDEGGGEEKAKEEGASQNFRGKYIRKEKKQKKFVLPRTNERTNERIREGEEKAEEAEEEEEKGERGGGEGAGGD